MRHTGLLSFDVPRDWEDKSEVRYEAPPRPTPTGEASPGRAVLARDRLRDDDDLATWLERRLAAIAARADGFVLRAVTPEKLQERPAMAARWATVDEGVPHEHRALAVLLADRTVAFFTLSAARTELAQLDPLFDRMMASARVE